MASGNVQPGLPQVLPHEEDRQIINASRANKIDALNDVLTLVESKKQLCRDKALRWPKSDGERIILRDLCEKTIRWVDKFKQAGDVAVQYDPVHASLPWAGVRFILQLAVSDSRLFATMMEGVEGASRLITHCAILKDLFLRSSSPAISDLVKAWVKLYAAMLLHLAKSGRYFGRSTLKSIGQSLLETEDSVKSQWNVVIEAEKDVERCFGAVGHETLVAVDTKLDDLLQSLDQSINRMASQLSELHDSF
ncbi:hypothetical protein IWX90DRAFT_501885 [Phyllosticta citrichinensis]|uniref:NWD NACHT-NTPase N-terminal domain-containing protein n=1 Tax=Phyllosticta citrichinensis TaxID=1130410 RepID=A0ABR1XX69_9PEZI